MNVNGYELIGNWVASNIGFTARATKGGKIYFLKKYGEYKLPIKEKTTEKTYNLMLKNFNAFKDYRERINNALKRVAAGGGNIILPTQWFVNEVNFIEATEFVNGVMSDADIDKIPEEKLKLVMLTAAAALDSVHSQGIVHSDLKRTNILVVKVGEGAHIRYLAKIIDFDKSYFVGELRENDLGGDQVFMSPELAYCMACECEDGVDKLSIKSDVYSLGLVFYSYLTKGKMPEVIEIKGRLKERKDAGKAIYCSEAQNADAKLKIGKEIKQEYLRCLIANMLYIDPAKRISAKRVLEVLRSEEVLDVESNQSVVVELEKRIPTTFCEMWPADAGYAWDVDKCKAAGYVASSQFLHKGKQSYELFKADKTSQVFILNRLQLLEFVKPASKAPSKPAPAPSKPTSVAPTTETLKKGEMWEDDADYVVLKDALIADGYVEFEKIEHNGKKLYYLKKSDGSSRILPIATLKILGYVKKND